MKEINTERIINGISETNNRFGNGILSELKKQNYIFPDFSKEFPSVNTSSFTSQGKTGYCWLLSAMQCMENFVHKKYNRTDIHFSREYLIFWDKIEKANWFLEQIFKKFPWNPEDRTIKYLLSRAMTDRGQWNMARNLVEKYGLVPIEASESIRNTGELNACLSMLLRSAAITLHQAFCDGKTQSVLIQLKDNLLMDVVTVLCDIYGLPTKEVALNSVPFFVTDKTVSPKEFYDRAIAFPFEEYISIFNDGSFSDDYIVDSVLLDTNMVGGMSPSFLHVTEDVFFESVLRHISVGEPCWFSCDAGKFNFRDFGIFDDAIFAFEEISPLLEQNLTKTFVNRYGIASMTHSMVMQQTKCIDSKRWWQAYDSAVYRSNTDHLCYLSDNWLKKYIFQAVVHKSYLNIDLLQIPNCREVNPWDLFNLGSI